jgi:hypothetical protein
MMGDIESMEFLCYTGTDWRSSWDTSLGDTNLPTAVQVKLLIASESGASPRNRQPIEMIVPLMTLSLTNMTNSATDSTGGGL